MKYLSRRNLHIAAWLAALTITVGVYRNHCPEDKCVSGFSVGTGEAWRKEDRMAIADRRSFEVLSTMMQRCPGSKQYVVEWSTDGEGPMGVVEGSLSYNSQTRTLDDRFNGTLASVSRADIQVIAKKAGDFAAIRGRVKHRPKP